MASTIFIHKEAGQRKDAVRVRSYNDIPEFLKAAISVTTEGIELDCVEGREVAPFGAVIGYEKSEKTSSGWNCWVIGNADTNLIEKDGVFYKKATIMKAQAVSKLFRTSCREHAPARTQTVVGPFRLTGVFPPDIREKHTGFCTGQRRTDRQTQTFSPRPKSPTENTLSAPVMARTLADWQKSILRKSIGELSNYGQVEAN